MSDSEYVERINQSWKDRAFSPTAAYIRSCDDRPGAFDPYTPRCSSKHDPPPHTRNMDRYPVGCAPPPPGCPFSAAEHCGVLRDLYIGHIHAPSHHRIISHPRDPETIAVQTIQRDWKRMKDSIVQTSQDRYTPRVAPPPRPGALVQAPRANRTAGSRTRVTRAGAYSSVESQLPRQAFKPSSCFPTDRVPVVATPRRPLRSRRSIAAPCSGQITAIRRLSAAERAPTMIRLAPESSTVYEDYRVGYPSFVRRALPMERQVVNGGIYSARSLVIDAPAKEIRRSIQGDDVPAWTPRTVQDPEKWREGHAPARAASEQPQPQPRVITRDTKPADE